jgi:hypothetical protein
MTHAPLRLLAVTFVFLGFAGSTARADLITWSYNWGSNPLSISADGASTGGISLSTPTGSVTGSSDIVAANLSTFSSALPGTLDTFTNKGYTLNLTLTDGPSGASGTLSFNGAFNGTLSPTSAQITNTFSGSTTGSLHLGNDNYVVTIGPYSAPGIPGSANLGSIGAHVEVTPDVISQPPPPPPPPPPTGNPPPVIDQAPEPATLVLAALSLPVLGAVRGWRRLKGKRLAA